MRLEAVDYQRVDLVSHELCLLRDEDALLSHTPLSPSHMQSVPAMLWDMESCAKRSGGGLDVKGNLHHQFPPPSDLASFNGKCALFFLRVTSRLHL